MKLKTFFRVNKWNIVAILTGIFIFAVNYKNNTLVLERTEIALLLVTLLYSTIILTGIHGINNLKKLIEISERVKRLHEGGYTANYKNAYIIMTITATITVILGLTTVITYSQEIYTAMKLFEAITCCIFLKTIIVSIERKARKEITK